MNPSIEDGEAHQIRSTLVYSHLRRYPGAPNGFGEEPNGGWLIPFFRQQEVGGLPVFIDSSIVALDMRVLLRVTRPQSCLLGASEDGVLKPLDFVKAALYP